MLVILLWTVLAAKSMAGPAPGPGSSLASGSEVQSLALRVMESDERCAEIRSILAEKVKTVSDTTGTNKSFYSINLRVTKAAP